MAALLHDHASMRQLAYDGEPDALHATARPQFRQEDCSGLDWSCTIARAPRLNNRWPGAPAGLAWDDLRVWNSGYWAGVLVSPRHLLVCHHYYQAVPSLRDDLLFLGADGTSWAPRTLEVHASVAQDLTVLALDQEAPPGILVLDRIADMATAPPGTVVWCQSPQSRSYAMLATRTLQWRDETSEWTCSSLAMAGHPDFPGLSGPLPAIWSGDSGTPAMVLAPDGTQALAGLLWSHAPIRFGRGPSEAVSPFEAIRAVVRGGGHDLARVDLGHPLPAPPARSPDIDHDGTVGAKDLSLLQSAWGPSSAHADLDRSGVVDAADMAAILGAWGPAGAAGGPRP